MGLCRRNGQMVARFFGNKLGVVELGFFFTLAKNKLTYKDDV